MDFVGFMRSTAGRLLRAAVGVALVLIGVYVVGGVWTWVLIVLGAVFIFVGLVNICLLAPLFGKNIITGR